MMYKTIYRFRVRVEDKPSTFPLHLCIYQNTSPQFAELMERMRRAASQQDLDLDEYLITVDSHKHEHSSCGAILHDDHSLQVALKTMSEHHYMELVLQHKRARTLSPPTHFFRRHTPPPAVAPSDPVPLIKPTVLRWSPGQPTDMRFPLNHSSSRNSSVDHEAIRKDSGISLGDDDDDNECEKQQDAKKQRVMSDGGDLVTRKLPELHSPPSQPTAFSHQHHRPSLFESPAIIHPLDFRRPSTAPPSPATHPSSTPSSVVKLPAISSFTSPLHDHIRSPPQTPCSIPASSPPPSIVPAAASAVSASCDAAAPALVPRRASSIKPAASSNACSTHRAPGQFLCEHIVDSASGRICGQTFRRSYDLSRHQSIHMTNRPFCYCSQCGKKFTRMDALRRHERVQGHFAAKRSYHRYPPLPTTMDRAQQARVQ